MKKRGGAKTHSKKTMTNFFHFAIFLLFALVFITQATPASHQDLLKRDSFAVSVPQQLTIRSSSVDHRLQLLLPSRPKRLNLLKKTRKKKRTTTNQRLLLPRPPRRLISTNVIHSMAIMDITEAGEEDIEDGEEEAGEEVMAGVVMDGEVAGEEVVAGVDTIEY
jgi:hypothetical protein